MPEALDPVPAAAERLVAALHRRTAAEKEYEAAAAAYDVAYRELQAVVVAGTDSVGGEASGRDRLRQIWDGLNDEQRASANMELARLYGEKAGLATHSARKYLEGFRAEASGTKAG